MNLLAALVHRLYDMLPKPTPRQTPVRDNLRASRAASIERQRKRRVQSPIERDVWPERRREVRP